MQTETPEEREHARYLGEIEVRKRHVADLQADFQLLEDKLDRFNAEYHSRIGALFIELDRIQLSIREYDYRIARLRAEPELNPADLERETGDRFTSEREDVRCDEEETRQHQRTYCEEQQHETLDSRSEAALKSVFRELARRFHPDLARTEAERQQRESIMKRITAAFHGRDIDALEAISAETVFEDPSFESRSIGVKLVWAIREVSRLDELISTIMAEREALMASDLAQLWQRQEGGENVIERLEHAAKREVELAQQRLREVIDAFHHVVSENSYDR